VVDILQSLREPMTITAYMTGGMSKLDLFIASLRGVLSRYEQAGKGKLKVAVVDPKTAEQKERAREAGLQEVAFGQSDSGDVATITRGYMGLLFEYGSEKEAIPVLSPDQTQGLEFWIANKMREIRDRADDRYTRIGVIAKEGIKITDVDLVAPQAGRPGPTIKSILAQALPFYKLEDVDLQDGDAAIDAELRGVVVLQADASWTDKELGRIDQFLMRGEKSLLVIAGAVNMKAADASMKGSLSTRGLERLLGGYGVEMKQAAIFDSGSQVRIPVQDQAGQMVWMTAPGVLELKYDADANDSTQTLDNGFAGFFRLDELAFPFPSVLIPHPDKQPGAKVTVVARSTATSTLETDATLDLKPRADWEPTGKAGQHAIAVTVEGKLKSAFGDQPPAGIDIAKESAKPSRLLVIASPQFLANPFARAGNPPPMPPQMKMMGSLGGDKTLQMLSMPYAQKYLTATILAFKNQLDWMAGDNRLIACSALLIAPPAKDEPTKAGKPEKKCSKEQMLKLMESGLTLDDALEVCRKQK
jgi:hypothetical protein